MTPLLSHAEERGEEAWAEYLQELYENSDEGAEQLETAYEQLTILAVNPLDINSAETAELLTIPGLNLDIINDLIEYREKYGNFKSLSELALIPSIDNRLRGFLCNFITVAEQKDGVWWSREELRKSLKNVRQTAILSATIPTYYRAGDLAMTGVKGNKYSGKYLGDPVKHSVRYQAKLGGNAAFNLTGAKSAAEPFGMKGNSLGYDAYAVNLTINHVGVLRRVILGHFRGQFGMGLTLNNNFTLGKQSFLSSIGRQTTVFTPHSSGSDYKHFQGVAAVVDAGKIQLSGFVSYRYIDATLNKDSSISTVLTSGTHQTELEMKKKNNSSQMASGLHAQYNGTLLQEIYYGVGTSLVYTHFNRTLNPTFSTADTVSQSKMYRLYYPHGQDFWNVSVDYMLRCRKLHFSGEVAINDVSALATVNTLLWRIRSNLSVAAVYRYYSYKYYAHYGNSFSEGSNVQNENGGYVALQWKPIGGMTLSAYTDIAYSAWLKYRISEPSYIWDNSFDAAYEWDSWKFGIRYRLRYKQRDMTVNKAKYLTWQNDQHLRLTAQYERGCWNTRMQIEGNTIRFSSVSKGWIVTNTTGYSSNDKWNVSVTGAYFNTDNYDARIYIYERGLQYSFGYSSYYGNGLRLAVLGKYNISKVLSVLLKVGHTHYFNQKTIGTEERTIYSNRKTDIDIQLKIKL